MKAKLLFGILLLQLLRMGKTDMAQWEVIYNRRFSREIIRAETFVQAVELAKNLAAERGLSQDHIVGVNYLAY